MNQDVVRRLVDHEARREARYRTLEEKLELALARTNATGFELVKHPPPPAVSRRKRRLPTGVLLLSTVCWLHHVVTEGDGLTGATRGRLRGVSVWIGAAGATLV